MNFEKEIPVEDFDTEFDTPIKSLRSDPPTQYFTNIDGKYVKDAEARQQLNDLEDYVQGISPVSLNVTENGTYTAPTGVFGYSPVTVNVSASSEPLSEFVFYAQDVLGDSVATDTYTVLENGRYLAINAIINNEASTNTLTSTVTSTGTAVDSDDISTSHASSDRNVSMNFSIIDCDANDTISFSSTKSGGGYICYCHAVLKIDDTVSSLTIEECNIKADKVLANPYPHTFTDSTKKHICVGISSRRDDSSLVSYVCDEGDSGSGQQANHLALSCVITKAGSTGTKVGTENTNGYASHGYVCYELG